MPNLEIITIGTELLLGEITDTNSTYIARTLRDHGIDIYRITTIGDNPARIAATIQEALGRAEIVITTGGLGPTVDDPTREAVAKAVNKQLVFKPDLWQQIVDRFEAYGRTPTENNRRQAHIPQGSIAVNNPVGTAPCFIAELGENCVISLPGVPQEMKTILHEAIIPYLSTKFNLKSQTIKATVLHAASIGESTVDEIINDLEQNANPSVGLLAHPGQVDIRVTAKADSELEALAKNQPVIEELINRLGDNIYGQDDDTLEGILQQLLKENNLNLNLIEFGLAGTLTKRLQSPRLNQIHALNLEQAPLDLETLINLTISHHNQLTNELSFGVSLNHQDRLNLFLVYHDQQKTSTKSRSYGGPPDCAQLWAQNTGLDFLRRELNQRLNQTTGES